MGLLLSVQNSRLHISRGMKAGRGIPREQGPQQEATALHNPRGIADITVRCDYIQWPHKVCHRRDSWRTWTGSTWREELERGPDPCLQIAKGSHGAKETDVFCVAWRRRAEVSERAPGTQTSPPRQARTILNWAGWPLPGMQRVKGDWWIFLEAI